MGSRGSYGVLPSPSGSLVGRLTVQGGIGALMGGER